MDHSHDAAKPRLQLQSMEAKLARVPYIFIYIFTYIHKSFCEELGKQEKKPTVFNQIYQSKKRQKRIKKNTWPFLVLVAPHNPRTQHSPATRNVSLMHAQQLSAIMVSLILRPSFH